ncbi:MAG: flavodoxin family protein, partial [Tannerellaceae bacterium]|nr:flavodoxin family protein [Tannerellaceae bacterium]
MIRREALKSMLVAGGATAASLISTKTNALEPIVAPLAGEAGETGNVTNSLKVLLINGSPNKEGCTYTALQEIAGALGKEGIGSEILYISSKVLSGCKGCGACRQSGLCIIDDIVNEVIGRLDEFDGFVFGSPVHYAAASGCITPF